MKVFTKNSADPNQTAPKKSSLIWACPVWYFQQFLDDSADFKDRIGTI